MQTSGPFRKSTAFLAVAGVFALWLCVLIYSSDKKINVEALEPLFTGLGFVIVTFTLVHERAKDSAENEERKTDQKKREQEHRELMHRMQVQIKATCHAARIAALTSAIDSDCRTLERSNTTGVASDTGSGLMATKRVKEIRDRLRRNEKAILDASEISEFTG